MIVVFSVDDPDSLYGIKNIFSYGTRYSNCNFVRVVVANKTDKERKVTNEQTEEYSEYKEVKYYEVSAKTGEGIKEMMDDLVNILVILKMKQEPVENDQKIEKAKSKNVVFN